MACVKCGRYGQAMRGDTSLDVRCMDAVDCGWARRGAADDEEAARLDAGGRAPLAFSAAEWRVMDDEYSVALHGGA